MNVGCQQGQFQPAKTQPPRHKVQAPTVHDSDLASPDVLDEHLGSYHVFSALTIEWTVLEPNNDEIYEQ